MVSNRIGRKTAPGFADPLAPAALENGVASRAARQQPPVAEPAPARPSVEAARTAKTPLVEVEVSYDRGPAPRTELMRRVYEVWTNNHVYALDSRLNCIEVRQPGSGKVVSDHPFIGTRLVGGQAQDDNAVEMSYPLPRPGAFAVFEARRGNRRHFSRTSAVTRVVLRLRIVSVTDRTSIPTWEEVSGEP